MKIDHPYIPLVKNSPKVSQAPHATAVPAVQEKPKRREEQPKKQSSPQNKKIASRSPLFNNLVARELSSRLASEVHKHENENEEKISDEYLDYEMTEEELLALQAEVEARTKENPDY